MPSLVNLRIFFTIFWKSHKIWDLKFTNKYIPGGGGGLQALPPGIQFFV